MVKTTLLFALVLVSVSADIGEKKEVLISIKGEGTDLMLATREDLGSFLCDNSVGASCEFVFTTDSGSDTVWNILLSKEGDEDCYKIVKANGQSAGQMMTASNNKKWQKPFGDGDSSLYTNGVDGESKCWEFEHVSGDDYKIKKKLGDVAGMYIRARPVNFKEQNVSKMRRFVEVSGDDTYNVWQVKNV